MFSRRTISYFSYFLPPFLFSSESVVFFAIHLLLGHFLSRWVFFSRRIPGSRVTVLGYGLLTTDAETLLDALNTQNFRVVIVDESHYMKSRTAARSKILLPMVQKARRAILLTGTPALGRPEEVRGLLCFKK
jgi:hypothetical protein